jgi:hypothetical protein
MTEAAEVQAEVEPKDLSTAALTPERSIADVRLGPLARWGILGLLLLLFFFGDGPIWDHPFNIDVAVWSSYAPIPVLAALALAAQRRLSLLTFSLNTMELTLTKFGITYTIATLLWAFSERPVPLRAWTFWPPLPNKEAPPEPAPVATPWPNDKRFDLRVRVFAKGQPRSDAVVFINQGLDSIAWAPPAPKKRIAWPPNQSDRLIIAHPFENVVLYASDKRMHAIQFFQGGVRAARPLLGNGNELELQLQRMAGTYTLRCAVHKEMNSKLLVLHHPHVARSNAQGLVELLAIPAVTETIGVDIWDARFGTRSKTITASAGQSLQLRIDY